MPTALGAMCRVTLEGPALKLADMLLQWAGSPHSPASAPPTLAPPSLKRATRSDTSLRAPPPKVKLSEEKSCESMTRLPQPKVSKEVEPINCRVLLEGEAGEIATSHLPMKNCGSTALYYSWEVSNF